MGIYGFFHPQESWKRTPFSPPFPPKNPYFSPPSSRPTMRNLRSDVQDVNATLLRLPQWRERPRTRSTISLPPPPPGKTPMATPDKEKGGNICSKNMSINYSLNHLPHQFDFDGDESLYVCKYLYIYIYVWLWLYMHMYTWNPNDLYFWRATP